MKTESLDRELQSLRIDRSQTPPPPTSGRSRRRWMIVGAIGVLLVVIAWFLYSKLFVAAKPVEVTRVVRLDPQREQSVLTAGGYIVAHHKIEVGSQVSGRVVWIGFEKGDRVKKGQVLVRLDDRDYRARVEEARGSLKSARALLQEREAGSRPEEIAAAKAAVEKAEADLKNAEVSLNRVRPLVRDGVLSPAQLDSAQALYDVAKAQLESARKNYELVRLGPRKEQVDAARAQVQAAEAGLRVAQTQWDYTVIRAPIEGTVLERLIEMGETVVTSAFGTRGAKSAVLSLADLNDLQVELDINQNDIAKVQLHQPCVISADAYPDVTFRGWVEEIAPEANRQKATVQVKVKIENPSEHAARKGETILRPEMNAKVSFLEVRAGKSATEAKPRIVVSKAAVFDALVDSAVRQKSVFVVVDLNAEGRGKARRRAIRAGREVGQEVEVLEGLSGGETVVTQGKENLKDGDAVQIRR